MVMAIAQQQTMKQNISNGCREKVTNGATKLKQNKDCYFLLSQKILSISTVINKQIVALYQCHWKQQMVKGLGKGLSFESKEKILAVVSLALLVGVLFFMLLSLSMAIAVINGS